MILVIIYSELPKIERTDNMPRGMRKSIDQQIEDNNAKIAELKDANKRLLDEKEKEDKAKLIQAVAESGLSIDEVVALIKKK